ncbi:MULTISPECIES: SusC/RagA family TonB-linked outer membrane protein [unclassified Proteiniphilum]|jgi:TonB-linked SusC/RagA family outer membrane protein|uniref:SusC/RagA family TonB-linked outer membrane protein n=2 Tax=Proteiniphilum TaxID=294702 RepID=UPI00257DFD88|nr:MULTISPECIES: TonB-dependent receptor [unclassified Proteiniphilum]
MKSRIKFIILCCIFIIFSLSSFAQQQIQVKGKVIEDETNSPLPGVSVIVDKSTRGVTTDIDGSFEIKVLPTDNLIFSFLGMESQTIKVNGRTYLEIAMKPQPSELDEVTVVAFAKQKKESVIGSISTVKTSELKVPSSNLTTAFAGRVAGLISYQLSGEPGKDNASFFVRGVTTFGAEAKKDPLILIDGVELTTDDLARLNTDDIATFSIMKDATATALYGARGANGVILVTTKEGREGKAKLNIRVENSISSPTNRVKLTDPITYMRMQNEAIKTRDPSAVSLYSEEKIRMTERGLYPDLYPSTDWYDILFNDVTMNQRANLSISGGGNIARYYVAAALTKDNGNLKPDSKNQFNSNIDLLKYNIRANVNINVTKTTEMIIKMNSSFDEYTGPLDGGADLYRKIMRSNPVLFKPYYEPDEANIFTKHILFGNYGNGGYLNPYAEAMKGYKDYSKNTLITQFEIKQDLSMITKGLTARAMVNMNRNSDYTVTRQYSPFFYKIKDGSYDKWTQKYELDVLNQASGTEWLDFKEGDRYIKSTFYLEAMTEYNRKFQEKHDVNALLVYQMREEKEGTAPDLQSSLPYRNLGLSGRLAYNYDTRYFGEFNFGYNGSERFSTEHRFGFFPSIGTAWMVSNEDFFASLKEYVPVFKLKATYGLVGNDAIGSASDRFYYLSKVNIGGSSFVNWGTNLDYNPGIVTISRYANDDIGWEKSYKTNLGFEILLKNGFSANADFFNEKREGILLSRTIPKTTGIGVPVKANLGKAKGSGIDVEFNYEKNFNKYFWLIGRGTFTYATSKVLEWEEPEYSDAPWRSRVGYSINQTWGYIAERLFLDEEEVKNSPTQFGDYKAGDIKYRDINGDGRISELDMVPIGYPTVPEINYGFGLSMGYKGLDFSFFFQGSGRQSFWMNTNKDNSNNIIPFLNGNNVLRAFSDSYWSESNPDIYAVWPRLANQAIDNNNKPSTWFMQDASFLRLKSAELGYTFPKRVMDTLHVGNLRLYLSGTNLLCFSNFKFWDPEMGGNGLGYPLQRVINIGLNVGF